VRNRCGSIDGPIEIPLSYLVRFKRLVVEKREAATLLALLVYQYKYGAEA